MIIENINDEYGVKVIHSIFEEPFMEQLENLLNNHISFRYGWKSNFSIPDGHWNQNFVANDFAENGLDVASQIDGIVGEAWSYLKTTDVGKGMRLIRCYMNAYTFGVEGYYHRDSKRDDDITLVVHLNKDWHRDWGGETTVMDENDRIVFSHLPALNKAIMFRGSALHCGRGITKICPALRTVLTFKMTPENCDPLRDRLQKFLVETGTTTKPHGLSSLAGHLLRTYDLLRSVGASDDVCLAGGVHSIFGTNIYQDAVFVSEDREQIVASHIGIKAARLAFLFSNLDRPSTLEQAMGESGSTSSLNSRDGTKIEVTHDELQDLCLIEAANLFDQSNDKKTYPKLSNLWMSQRERTK